MINKNLNLHENIFTDEPEKVPTRNGYGDGVVAAGKQNEKVVVLSADLTESTRSDQFREEFPERFVEVGVAEQNMAGIAAGLALENKIPFISSYAVFNPGRNFDQIRVSICYTKANVKIIGAHAGLSVGPDGATHQALEDIAMMRALPNLTVLSPADYEQAKKATISAAKHVGPTYIRLAREKTPVFTTPETPFEIGKAYSVMEGRDLTIFSTGPILFEAMKAAQELNEERGVSCEVVNVPTIKPLDKKFIIEKAKKTGLVVTVEEHQINGGLGGAITELLSENHPVPIKIIGVEDTFGESGPYDELWEKYGINARHIEIQIREFMRKWEK